MRWGRTSACPGRKQPQVVVSVSAWETDCFLFTGVNVMNFLCKSLSLSALMNSSEITGNLLMLEETSNTTKCSRYFWNSNFAWKKNISVDFACLLLNFDKFK